MPEDIPPLPSASANPPLSAEVIANDKAAGTSLPGAGGWCPTPMQQAMGAGACAALMGLAPVLLELPSPYGKVLAGLCGALSIGLGVFLGTKSAGPRRAQ